MARAGSGGRGMRTVDRSSAISSSVGGYRADRASRCYRLPERKTIAEGDLPGNAPYSGATAGMTLAPINSMDRMVVG